MTSRRAVTVFGSSQTRDGTGEWRQAEEAGRRLSEAGLAVVTGGYGGTMEAVSKGAYLVGGHVIGVTAPSLFPWRSGANPYVTELIEADNLTHRIGILMELAVATIALPGSIGTATELMVAWNMNQTAKRGGGPPLPTVAVGEQWGVVIEMLAREINADATDIKLVATTNEAIDWVMVALEIH